jgi:hypothetical protein
MILVYSCLLGPVASLAQADPIELYLASAEQKATAVVNSAGAQGRGIAMEAAQAALNAIGAFRAAYADSLRQTGETLTGQQADLFRKIHIAMEQLDAYQTNATTNLRGIAGMVAAAIRDLPLSKDIPRVTDIFPLYLVEGQEGRRELVLHGIGLANGSPLLRGSMGTLRPSTATDTELRFALPPLAAASNHHPALVPMTLQLFERKTHLLFFSSFVSHTSPVTLAVYAREIGPVAITPRRRVASIESRPQRTQEYRCDSPRGEGSATVPVNVVPTPGWNIDISSIRYDRNYSNHGSFTMGTTSATGFTASLSCSGWGRVVALGIVVDQGSIGVEKGGFTFTETRSIETLQNGASETRSLRWGDSLAISDLPNDTETIVVELKPFTGDSLAMEGEGSNRFLRVTFNRVTRVATLAAKTIEGALRQ